MSIGEGIAEFDTNLAEAAMVSLRVRVEAPVMMDKQQSSAKKAHRNEGSLSSASSSNDSIPFLFLVSQEAFKKLAHDWIKPLDQAIVGVESSFEEEIGLYQTFGGD